MSASAQSQSKEKRYVLQFGLARQNVALEPHETKQLTEDMKEALFELAASAWGVSVETYKSTIACTGQPWIVNARYQPSAEKDLSLMEPSVPTATYNIVTFLNNHKFTANCKKAAPVQDLLLSDAHALEQFLKRSWNASGHCLVLNQLFESDSQKGLRASMPPAFFYCIKKFMDEERSDDDAACCQFGEQLFLVMHLIVKEYLNGLVSLLCELDEREFSDELEEAYSIEIPEYVWNYAQPAEQRSGDHSIKKMTLEKLQVLRNNKQSELQPSSNDDNQQNQGQQLLQLLVQGLRQSSNDNTDKYGDQNPVDPV